LAAAPRHRSQPRISHESGLCARLAKVGRVATTATMHHRHHAPQPPCRCTNATMHQRQTLFGSRRASVKVATRAWIGVVPCWRGNRELRIPVHTSLRMSRRTQVAQMPEPVGTRCRPGRAVAPSSPHGVATRSRRSALASNGWLAVLVARSRSRHTTCAKPPLNHTVIVQALSGTSTITRKTANTKRAHPSRRIAQHPAPRTRTRLHLWSLQPGETDATSTHNASSYGMRQKVGSLAQKHQTTTLPM